MFGLKEIGKKLHKQITFFDGLTYLLFIVSYFATRIIRIQELPIFTDEGIYIRWAKVAWHDASWRFISLTDGKQPLQTWATIPLLKLFPQDAFLAGRLFGVMSGFFALLGLFFLLYYLFGKKAAKIGSLLYIVSPMFLFYDRMALTDSLVNAFFLWIVFLSILLINTMRIDIALILGLVAGLGLLTKSSVQMFVSLSIFFSFILFSYKKKGINGLVSLLVLFSLVFFISQSLYNIQRLSPFMHYVAAKNTTFVMTFQEWLSHPFSVLFSNLKSIPYYVFSELGWIIAPMTLMGFVSLFNSNKKIAFYFLAWMLIPYVAISFMTKVLFPRYLIFFGSLAIIFCTVFLLSLPQKIKSITLLIVCFILFFLQLPQWTNYADIKTFPPVDRGQYIEGAASGYGIKEIITFARKKSVQKPVLLIAEGNFGMSADVLDAFLKPNDSIAIQGYWPLDETKLALHQSEVKQKYVYVVTAHKKEIPYNWPVKLIQRYDAHKKDSAILFLELVP